MYSAQKKKILKELKENLNKKFHNNIEKVILFGSQVYGVSKGYSDYDILVILNGSYDWKTENAIFDEAYEIDLKYGILTDIKVISVIELSGKKGKLPYIEEAMQKGIAV